jgi:hypothetical protein
MKKNMVIEIGLLPEQKAYFWHKERIETNIERLSNQIAYEGGLDELTLLNLRDSIEKFLELKKSPANQFKIGE